MALSVGGVLGLNKGVLVGHKVGLEDGDCVVGLDVVGLTVVALVVASVGEMLGLNEGGDLLLGLSVGMVGCLLSEMELLMVVG